MAETLKRDDRQWPNVADDTTAGWHSCRKPKQRAPVLTAPTQNEIPKCP